MGAHTYALQADIVDAGDKVILQAGNYRVQDSQITLIDGKQIHILINRINTDTYVMDQLTFIVENDDLNLMSDSMTTGLAFSDELDVLIWGWLFGKKKALVLIGREALFEELLPVTTKV